MSITCQLETWAPKQWKEKEIIGTNLSAYHIYRTERDLYTSEAWTPVESLHGQLQRKEQKENH
jgi:hypothetical protein